MLPLVLLLVLNGEVVAHHNEVTVFLSVLKGNTKDVSKDIKTGSPLALRIIDLKCCSAIEEFEEVQSLDDLSDGLLLKTLVSSKVSHIGTAEHTLDQKAVILLHSIR